MIPHEIEGHPVTELHTVEGMALTGGTRAFEVAGLRIVMQGDSLRDATEEAVAARLVRAYWERMASGAARRQTAVGEVT